MTTSARARVGSAGARGTLVGRKSQETARMTDHGNVRPSAVVLRDERLDFSSSLAGVAVANIHARDVREDLAAALSHDST
jgi:hypothetical protein